MSNPSDVVRALHGAQSEYPAHPPLIFVLNKLIMGGAERQLLRLAKGLMGRGHRCVVVELLPGSHEPPVTGWISDALNAGVIIQRSGFWGSYLAGARRLIGTVNRWPGAIVWSWGYRADAVSLACVGLRRRIWVSSLRSASNDGVKRSRHLWWLAKFRVSMVVANTEAGCRMLIAAHPALADRCRVMYNAIDFPVQVPNAPAIFSRARPLRLIMLGNLRVRTKGYDLALELMSRLVATGHAVELRIAGRSDDNGWLMREIAARRLQSTVFYHGSISDIDDFFARGDAFLLFSRYEGTPNALLEAMSFGKPCIATAVGDLPQLVRDAEQLRLIAVEDVTAAVAAVESFLADWPAALDMGERGREWCRKVFSIEAAVTCCEGLLQDVMCR